ncbi:MAG: ABC transporter permease, partial [Bifidobacteriaceae bacterium]|nr:ABC transporter permease [Bifidobacteriaceae bacterium]
HERARAEFGDVDLARAVALVFGLVSLLTAALVIANTFQVTIAGRTRTLALLRSVGATSGQIGRSVMTEALITGLIASIGGLAAGWGLIRLALLVAGRWYPTIPVPSGVAMSPVTIAAGLVIGTLTTVVASLAPARLATAVAPIEALRPREAPRLAAPAGRTRLRWSVGLAAFGVVALVGSVYLTNSVAEVTYSSDAVIVLGAAGAVVGGGSLAAGVIVGAVFWLPKVVGRIAALLARRRGGVRIAAANVTRNPRRTAATATALMIGVTLVSSMLVAAACFTRSFEHSVMTETPVDLQVGYAPMTIMAEDDPYADEWEDSVSEIDPALIDELEAVDGLSARATIGTVPVVIEDDEGTSVLYTVVSADPEELRETLNIPDLADRLEPGAILVDGYRNEEIARMGALMSWSDEEDASETPSAEPVSGSVRVVSGLDGTAKELKFIYAEELDFLNLGGMVADEATLAAFGAPRTVAVMMKVSPQADAAAVQNTVLDTVTSQSANEVEAYPVTGSAVAAAETRKALATMLLIGLALLAVSVVVALIGVSNTLSLSVIERRHETALLRALGLTRGQSRWMMAVEALVIAGVAGLMGIIFGIVYGLAAGAVLLAPTVGLVVALPGWSLAAVMALTLAAGLAASILPGRRVARIPPAAALAAE